MKVGITACSNPQQPEWKQQNELVVKFLHENGHLVELSKCIYEPDSDIFTRGKLSASELNRMFADTNITEIYDISGGDMANEVLDFLDYDMIRNSKATFWGYSDLTTVINAIYTMTGKSSVLYQIKNLCAEQYSELQRHRYVNRAELFDVNWQFIQGTHMEGTVIGGNIRCFLKLAGTKYMPDFQDKILFLESWGGQVPQMITYMSQLRSLGAFDKVKGIRLGTFTTMEKEQCQPDIIGLVQHFAGSDMPIAKTMEVGHSRNAKAIRIGEHIEVTK